MLKKTYQTKHRNKIGGNVIDDGLFASMYELLTHIGIFWRNTPTHANLQTDLFTFMTNRIALDGNYLSYYQNAQTVIDEFIAEHNGDKNAAYADFFTQKPEKGSDFEQARNKVSNEFIAFQLSVGGFASFGAKNYPAYIEGGYVPNHPAPYRTH